MVFQAIERSLEGRNYSKAVGNVVVADFFINVDEDKKMTICSVIKNVDGTSVSQKQIIDTAKQLERKFLIEGYRDVQIMHIIVTDHDEQVDKLQEENIKFWIVDLQMLRLLIYENQPENFELLKKVIEDELYDEGHSFTDRKRIQHSVEKRSSGALITAAIVLINVLVYIACEMAGGSLNDNPITTKGALDYRSVVEYGQYYRLFSCMFIHFGLDHIVNNMFSLIVVGSQIERVMGRINYVLVYFASGFGASVCSLIYHMKMNDLVISAGASGAIYGLFGAILALAFMDKRIDVRRVLACLIVMVLTGIGPEVDAVAHIGGLIVGIITTMVLKHNNSGTISLDEGL